MVFEDNLQHPFHDILLPLGQTNASMGGKITEIIICLGSSCFARGNKKTLSLIQDYLKNHNLEHVVNFKGNHCFGKCQQGPILKINNQEYEGVNESDVLDILERELGKIKPD